MGSNKAIWFAPYALSFEDSYLALSECKFRGTALKLRPVSKKQACVFLPDSPLADTRSSLVIVGHTHLVAAAFDLKTGVFGWIKA